MPRQGGCFCGAIRYRAAGAPVTVTHCHCLHCRRTSAAPFVTWAEFDLTGFAFTRGAPVRYLSRPTVTRTCCGRCGTQLTYRRDGNTKTIDVTVCSLDRPERLVPRDHVWHVRRLPWVRLADRLPRYRRRRTPARARVKSAVPARGRQSRTRSKRRTA